MQYTCRRPSSSRTGNTDTLRAGKNRLTALPQHSHTLRGLASLIAPLIAPAAPAHSAGFTFGSLRCSRTPLPHSVASLGRLARSAGSTGLLRWPAPLPCLRWLAPAGSLCWLAPMPRDLASPATPRTVSTHTHTRRLSFPPNPSPLAYAYTRPASSAQPAPAPP